MIFSILPDISSQSHFILSCSLATITQTESGGESRRRPSLTDRRPAPAACDDAPCTQWGAKESQPGSQAARQPG